jgi:hypothetical protein
MMTYGAPKKLFMNRDVRQMPTLLHTSIGGISRCLHRNFQRLQPQKVQNAVSKSVTTLLGMKKKDLQELCSEFNYVVSLLGLLLLI